MVKKKSLREKIRIFLCEENKGNQFSSRAIAKELFERDREYYEGRGRTAKDLICDVSAILSRHAEELELEVFTSSTPREFRYTGEESESTETKDSKRNSQPERGLYVPVQQYLKDVLGVYPKEVIFSNKKGPTTNDWLHPDIVGMEDLASSWKNEEVKKLADESNSKKARLWSIEVKCDVDKTSVRQNFFQAVANSSWANFGYLAVENIINPKEGMVVDEELRMLANLYGIGVIKINKEEPLESKILIPAKEREINMVACSRLAQPNNNFEKFIEEVRNFYRTEKIDKLFWKIPEISEEGS